MREQKTKAQVKKTNYDIIPNTHALYLYPHPDMNQPPTTKKGRKTAKENKSYHTAWTHIWIPALREVNLEPSTKRATNRTEALVNPTKSHTNQPR